MRMPGILLLAAACALAAPRPLLANTYTVVMDPSISWSQARAAAVTAGGYLATISSASENAAVLAAIAGASPPANGGFWIGLYEFSECCYHWDNNDTGCYGNFYYAEPNNGGGTEDKGQMMWSSDLSRRGFWNDVPNAGLPGSSDISRAGYVIEFGPTFSEPCLCVPVSPASFCDVPTPGAHVVSIQFSGVATGPGGVVKRTISDVTEPDGPNSAGVLATYIVTVPIGTGTTAADAATAFRDGINNQAGSGGFHAQFPTANNTAEVRMHRPSGPPYTSVDENTVPGLGSSTTQTGPIPGIPVGPGLSRVGLAIVAVLLMVAGSWSLRRRRAFS